MILLAEDTAGGGHAWRLTDAEPWRRVYVVLAPGANVPFKAAKAEHMSNDKVDVVLVGAGIMSTTLGVFLKELKPDLRLEMIERMPGEAQESSGAWNNAGTGHAANCELNYTPMRADGSVDIAKALEVNVEFDLSRQFWSYLIRKGAIATPDSFIHPVPHMSFVIGTDRQAFLKKRHAAMSAHPCYHGMEYTEDHAQDRANGCRWSWKAAIPRSRSRRRASSTAPT